ncbi:MAG: hypothetical protein EOP83_20040 [Verrucomicrobiaceae bacterium]|nr:MAG: hypothetical protein EOP83_20040 [Verrucomicrobiaceae bacterium]
MRYITTYTSEAIRDRQPNEHGLRCNFRRMVNAGMLLSRDYDHFVSIVNRYGSIALAVKYFNGVHDDILKSLRAVA